MASETDVINAALDKLGVLPIGTHPDTSSPQGRLAARSYAGLRDRLMRAHPWNFLMKRSEEISADLASPEWEFDNFFSIPTDSLRVMEVENATQSDWKVEQGKIATDLSAPIKIRYLARITDPTRWDALFYDAMASFLAKEWALKLTQQAELEKEKKEDFKSALAEARTADGQEGFPEVLEASEWLDSRFR